MNRYTRKRESALPPVQRITLDGEHSLRRLLLAAALLAVALLAFWAALRGLLSTEPGWRTIPAEDAGGGELNFQYRLPQENSTQVYRQVSATYSDAALRAYQVYHSGLAFEEVGNLYAVNANVNREVMVEPELYAAFQLLERSGSRALYLAPVYAEYESLFHSESDAEARDFDPRRNEDQAAYFRELLAFTGSEEHITLRLLGENRVRLEVSEEYLNFAGEYGIQRFLDFGWIKNAFVVDDICAALREKGLTQGTLASVDGFGCTLDESGETYALSILDRQGSTVYPAAQVEYSRPLCWVSLHGYPIEAGLAGNYYQYEDGETVTAFLDPADGLCKSAVSDLLAYSYAGGCAELLLRVSPVYTAETLNRAALAHLAADGVESVYCAERVVWYTDTALTLTGLYKENGLRYTARLLTGETA